MSTRKEEWAALYFIGELIEQGYDTIEKIETYVRECSNQAESINGTDRR